MRLIPATGNRPISASIGDRLARVFLAGDWTATGWPATMEGAVRSGYLAAEALAGLARGKSASFLVPTSLRVA